MYSIQYSKEDPLFIDIKKRLEHFSLAFKIKEDSTLSKTILVYSDQIWTEKEAIFNHLNQTEKELERWHYCNC